MISLDFVTDTQLASLVNYLGALFFSLSVLYILSFEGPQAIHGSAVPGLPTDSKAD